MPPEWLVRRVLLGPAPLRKVAAAQADDPQERWMLCQSADVRRSYVRQVIDEGVDEEAWMLLQPDEVRHSYVAEVLGHEA